MVTLVARAQIKLLSTDIIWGNNNYSAFTSLVYHEKNFYCAFRQASAHHVTVSDSSTFGEIIIIKSPNGTDWELFQRIADNSSDLRDPKLSVTPDGRLLLLYCSRSIIRDSIYMPAVTKAITFFNHDSVCNIEKQIPIIVNNYDGLFRWLWGITWHKEVSYGFMYGSEFLLLASKDGIEYEVLAKLEPFGENPTEGTMCFLNDTAICVVRGKDNVGIHGWSLYPYRNWNWEKMNIKLGGPALLCLPNQTILLGTRNYQDDIGCTSLYVLNGADAKKLMTLPSQRDSSYPAMILHDGYIYISFYSGNSEVCNIYLSTLVYEED